jgi:hypothetical protein
MNAASLLSELTRRGVSLEPRGAVLHYRAPCGSLTPELRAALVKHKPTVLALLQNRVAALRAAGDAAARIHEHCALCKRCPPPWEWGTPEEPPGLCVAGSQLWRVYREARGRALGELPWD